MTSTDPLSAAWGAVEADVKSRPGGGLLRRRIADTGAAELHLAHEVGSGQWELLVGVPPDWRGDLGSMPHWRGVTLELHEERHDVEVRRFIAIRMDRGGLTEAFRALATDLVSVLSDDRLGPNTASTLVTRLAAWKRFFDTRGPEGLSPEAQAGLFGELWFLRQHLLPAIGPSKAVEAWTGSGRSNHDFQLASGAFEVKTTTGKEHLKLHVSSERQLDVTGLDALHIVYLVFALLAAAGETLPEIVGDIRSKLSGEGMASIKFSEKLIEAGYIEDHADRYKAGYALRSGRAYRVREGFPRLTAANLPEGVGDLSYTVVVAACEPFRTTIDDAVKTTLHSA